jgi:hypothetical protein
MTRGTLAQWGILPVAGGQARVVGLVGWNGIWAGRHGREGSGDGRTGKQGITRGAAAPIPHRVRTPPRRLIHHARPRAHPAHCANWLGFGLQVSNSTFHVRIKLPSVSEHLGGKPLTSREVFHYALLSTNLFSVRILDVRQYFTRSLFATDWKIIFRAKDCRTFCVAV